MKTEQKEIENGKVLNIVKPAFLQEMKGGKK